MKQPEMNLVCGSHLQTLLVADSTQPRTFITFIPPTVDLDKPIPLVFLLHGRNHNGRIIEEFAGMNPLAEKEGFVIVYPEASGNPINWNAGFNAARHYPLDDMAYFRTLFTHVCDSLPVDRERVYVAGHSSGAMMTYRIAGEMSDSIAAIGIVSGAIGTRFADEGVVQISTPSSPLSVIIIHGMKDDMVPYDSLKNMLSPGEFFSVREAVDFWVKVGGCEQHVDRESLCEGKVIRETYHNPANGIEVELLSVVDGNHYWPGGMGERMTSRGANQDISATQEIWNFFLRHKKTLA